MFSNVWPSSNEGTETANKSTRDEVSLTSILPTPALRTELALLVALCTDNMRRNLLSAFDAPQTNASALPSPIPPAADDGRDKEMAAAAEEMRKHRGTELSSPQMLGLRRAALTFFDAWQVSVLRRVGQAVGVRSEAVRLARRQHAASTAALVEEKRVKEYWNWADGNDEAEEDTDEVVNETTPFTPVPTRLSKLDEPTRKLVLNCLLLLLLSLEQYSAHSRVLLHHVTASLILPVSVLSGNETTVAQGLLAAASSMSADESAKKTAASDSVNRRWKVGLATVAGAALIGVTGGLAAPLLAAGVGTVMGGLGLGATALSGLLGSLAGSSVLIGGLFGAYGGKMTGRMMDKYAKEVEDFKFVPLREDPQHELRVAIGISGWLEEEADMVDPWRVLSSFGIESFSLRWERDVLMKLGASITSILNSYAWDIAKLEIVRATLLGSLYAGLWPLGLLKMASVADNPFSVAKARADKAGRVLAEALMDKCQGERPVTLIGYSLGARVIYTCLLSLAEHNAFGLIESVILAGAPIPSSGKDWARIRAIVTGRLINVYSTDDYVLGFLYRTSSIQFGVAGLQQVKDVNGVENVDVTALVKGHKKYRFVMGQILKHIGFEDVDNEKVQMEVAAIKSVEKKEKQKKQEMASELLIEVEGRVKVQNDGQVAVGTTHMIKPRGPQLADPLDGEVVERTKSLSLGSKDSIQESDSDSDTEPEDGRIQMLDLDPEPLMDDIEPEVQPRRENRQY